MADPFSIIALVSSSLSGIIKAKKFLDGVHRAPQSVQTVSVELRAIESLLRELGNLLNGFSSATREQASRLVRDAVRNCEELLRQIDKLIRPFVASDPNTKINTWKRFAFNFRESDIVQLRREMEACKQTLNMAITCANLLATHEVDRRVKRIQRHFDIASSVAGSDIEVRKLERTQQWISEAKTIAEDENHEGIASAGAIQAHSATTQELTLTAGASAGQISQGAVGNQHVETDEVHRRWLAKEALARRARRRVVGRALMAKAEAELASQQTGPKTQDQDAQRRSKPPTQARQRLEEKEVPTPELTSEKLDEKVVDSSANSYRISLPLYPVTNQERGSHNATDTTTTTDETWESFCDRSFNPHQNSSPSPEDISAVQSYQPRDSAESQQQPGPPELLSTPKLKGILKTPSPKLGGKPRVALVQDVVTKQVNAKSTGSGMPVYGYLHPKDSVEILRDKMKGESTTMELDGPLPALPGLELSGEQQKANNNKENEQWVILRTGGGLPVRVRRASAYRALNGSSGQQPDKQAK